MSLAHVNGELHDSDDSRSMGKAGKFAAQAMHSTMVCVPRLSSPASVQEPQPKVQTRSGFVCFRTHCGM
jgi:hypothetical protein